MNIKFNIFNMLGFIWNKVITTSPAKCIALFFLLAAAFAAGINYLVGFDGIDFNGDCYVYFQMAKYFKQSLSNLILPDHHLHWPYGYPAFLSISFLFFGETFKAAQWINLIAGGALITILGSIALFVARIKVLDSEKTILFVLAAMLMLIGRGIMLKYQLIIMSDMMGAFWAMLTVFLIWKWAISKKRILLLLAGIAFGLAISTRYVYVLVAVPLIVVALSELSLRQLFFQSLFFILGLLIGVFPEMMIALNGSSHGVNNELLDAWEFKNLFALTLESVSSGQQKSRIPSLVYYAIAPFRWEDFSPLGLIFVCLGFYYAVLELPRWLWLSLLLWYLTFYIFLCGIPIRNPRLAFSLYLPLSIFVSFGVLWCLHYWQTKRVMWCVILLTFVSIIFSTQHIKKLVESKNELLKTSVEVAILAKENSRIISTSLYAVYHAYPAKIEPKSIYSMSISEAKVLLSDGKKTFLAIDNDKFIPNYGNYPAGKTYLWIRNHYICDETDHSGEFTIYQIK